MKQLLASEPKMNSKKVEFFQVEGTDFSIPVAVIKGRKFGKKVLITIGCNSTMEQGIRSFLLIVKEIIPATITGQLILVPYLNDCQHCQEPKKDLYKERFWLEYVNPKFKDDLFLFLKQNICPDVDVVQDIKLDEISLDVQDVMDNKYDRQDCK